MVGSSSFNLFMRKGTINPATCMQGGYTSELPMWDRGFLQLQFVIPAKLGFQNLGSDINYHYYASQ